MKIISCALAALLTMGSCPASDAPDSTALAAGYAKAFECSARVPVSISYLGAASAEITVKDIVDLKAFDGVLLIKTGSGERLIIDAARVVRITNR